METNNAAAAQTLSALVLAKVAQGLSPVDALRAVCGTEIVDQMIDTLYSQLRTVR